MDLIAVPYWSILCFSGTVLGSLSTLPRLLPWCIKFRRVCLVLSVQALQVESVGCRRSILMAKLAPLLTKSSKNKSCLSRTQLLYSQDLLTVLTVMFPDRDRKTEQNRWFLNVSTTDFPRLPPPRTWKVPVVSLLCFFRFCSCCCLLRLPKLSKLGSGSPGGTHFWLFQVLRRRFKLTIQLNNNLKLFTHGFFRIWKFRFLTC